MNPSITISNFQGILHRDNVPFLLYSFIFLAVTIVHPGWNIEKKVNITHAASKSFCFHTNGICHHTQGLSSISCSFNYQSKQQPSPRSSLSEWKENMVCEMIQKDSSIASINANRFFISFSYQKHTYDDTTNIYSLLLIQIYWKSENLVNQTFYLVSLSTPDFINTNQ